MLTDAFHNLQCWMHGKRNTREGAGIEAVEITPAVGREQNKFYLVNGVLTGCKQVLVGTAAHVEEEFLPIANLNQEAGRNLRRIHCSTFSRAPFIRQKSAN
jgi:hypothetical protein